MIKTILWDVDRTLLDFSARTQHAFRQRAHQAAFRPAVDKGIAALADEAAERAHRRFERRTIAAALAPRYTVIFIGKCSFLLKIVVAILSRYRLFRKQWKIDIAGIVPPWYDVLAAHAEKE